MANRYWRGGAGTWNTTLTTNWSTTSGGSGGASVPTAADSVFFDQAGTYTVTMTGALTCLDITVSAGTVTFATGTSPTLAVSGSMSLTNSTAWNSTGVITFNATTSQTISTGTVIVNASFVFNGVGGTWTLSSDLTLTNTLTATLTNGALALDTFTLTAGIFSSSNTNTRSIAFGTGKIVLGHPTAATTVLSMATATNFSWTGTGGFEVSASNTKTLTFGTTGGSATNSPNLTFTGSGTAIPTLTTGSYFNKLDFGTTAFTIAATNLNLNSLTLSSQALAVYNSLTATMRGTGTITPNTNTSLGVLVINNGAGTATLAAALSVQTFTMTAGAIDFATFNLTGSSAATYAAGTLSNIGTISCTTWTVNGTFTLTQGTLTPSVSFVLTGGAFNYNGGTLSAVPTFTHSNGSVTLGQAYALTATGTYTLNAGTLALAGFTLTTGIFSSTNANTRSITFGAGNIVLAHTTAATTVLSMANATGFTLTGTGGFTTDASITRTLTFGTTGGTTNNSPNVTLTGSGTAVVTLTNGSYFNKADYGTTAFAASTILNLNSLTLSSGGTFTSLQPTMVGTGTITPNGNTTLGSLAIGNISGTTTLAGALTLTATATTSIATGGLVLANFTLTTGIFNAGGSSTRSIAFGTGNIVLTHTTAGQTVLAMLDGTNFTYTGTGGFTSIMSVTRIFQFGTTGGSSTNAPNLTLSSGSSVATLTTGSYFNKLDFGTTSFTIGTTALNLNGLTLSSGGTFTTLTPTMRGTGTITSNGNSTLAAMTINSTSGTTTLGAALSLTATSTVTLTSGTLALAGFTLTTGIFSSTGTGVRAIAFGTGTTALAHTTAATTVLDMANASNFSVTGAGGFTAVMSVTRTFVFGTTGGSPSNSPNLTLSSGSSVATITTASWLNTLDFGTSSGIPTATALNLNGLTLGSASAYTNITPTFVGPGTITPNSLPLATVVVNTPPIVTSGGSLYFRGGAYYTGAALAANQLTGDYTVEFWFYQTVAGKQGLVTITNTTSSGANGFSVYIDTTNSLTMFIDGNVNIVTSATNIFSLNTWNAIAVVYVASSTQAKLYLNGTSVATLTRSSTWPATPTIGIGRIFNDLVASTFSGYMSNLRILKGTALYTANYTPPTTPLTAITNTYLLNLQDATVTDNSGNGLTFSTAGAITQNENSPFTGTAYSASTTTLAGSLTTNTSFTLTSGNLDITGDTLTPTQFISAGGVVGTARSITGGGTGIISLANNWSVTTGSSFTGSGYTINMTSASTKTFGGSGGAYGTLVQAGAGALTISGSNSFEDIQATTRPSTVTFTAGTTQTVAAFTLSGVSGSQVTVNSTVNGTQYTLSKSSGAVTPTYISIRDSNVTGGATWDISGVGVVDVSNNTGWSSGVFAALSGVNAFGNVQTILALNEQALTGTAASGFVGTISLDSLLGVDGVSALFSVGAVSADSSVALTYVLASGFAGTISAESIIDTTGVPAFGTVGTIVPSGNITLQVTSVLGSGSVGDLSAAITNDLSNVLASGFAGTTNLNSLIGISGVLAEGAVNTISFQLEFPLTNVVASGTVGTVQFGNGFDLTGVLGSGFVGNVQFGNAYNLTSVLASGAVDSLGFSNSPTLTGTLASGAVNTFQLTRNSDLTGDAAVGGVGSVQFGNGYGLTGVQAEGVVGSLANASTYAIFGMSATGTAQSLFSGKTFGITGTGGTGSVGTLLFGRSFGLTGVLASGVVENLVLANTVGVNGVLSSGTVGIVVAVTPDIVRSITGVLASGALGTVIANTPDRVVAITSVAALAEIGIVIGVYPDKSIAVTGVQAEGAVGNTLAVYWGEVDTDQTPDWATFSNAQNPGWVVGVDEPPIDPGWTTVVNT